jgi:hypothetical protein
MNENKRTPNFFWPVILIGVGAILLLTNLGLMEFEVLDLVNIARLWPLLLVAIGVNLLFGRNASWVGSAISLLLGLSVIAFVVFGPSFIEPLPGTDLVTESFSDPLTDAESARVNLDFDRGTLEVSPLMDSDNLIETEVTHNGSLDFSASGDSRRNVTLKLDSDFAFWEFDFLDEQQIEGIVGLNPELPIELLVDIGGGNADLDLVGLNLTSLEVDSGSGRIELVMPSGQIPANLGAGSGRVAVQTVEETELDLEIEVGSGRITLGVVENVFGKVDLQSGSGSITVYLPEGLAVRLTGTAGSGSVNVPNDFDRISVTGNTSGDSGTWQSPGFDQADEQLVIEFGVGSGSVRVRYE